MIRAKKSDCISDKTLLWRMHGAYGNRGYSVGLTWPQDELGAVDLTWNAQLSPVPCKEARALPSHLPV